MKQHIDTKLGVSVILIIAITMGAFVWKWEKMHKIENSDFSFYQKQSNKDVKQQTENNLNSEASINLDVSTWKTYKNSSYVFEIKYPPSYLFDENLINKTEYSINFGPSYEETFGKPHSVRKSVSNFELYISKNEDGIDNFIEKENSVRGEVEQSSKILEDENINNIPAKIVKACNMGNICDKIIYFTYDNYVYSINMKGYFNLEKEVDKKIFNQMLSSLSIK